MRYRAWFLGLAAAGLACGTGMGLPGTNMAQARPANPAHQRVLPLEGGRNFRDLGGYRTKDGRHVKWGMLYRSGSMVGLTAGDYAELERRGIRVVCDFRSTPERKAEPAAWPAAKAPVIFADDYDLQATMPKMDMRKLSTMTYEQARDGLAGMYPSMLVQFNGQYRRMFAELLAGHAPLAFNCSAGKDRTGIAAALLLTALGVPRATVIDDYLLTNRYLKPQQLLGKASPATAPADWAKAASPVTKAFLLADRAYIQAALDVMDRHAGGAQGYLRDELGLSKADLRKLRGMYLR